MTPSMLNNISVSISDDDSDDYPGSMRVRGRRRRKRHRLGSRSEALQLLVRFLRRYWTLMIFIPAIVILFFELPSIGRKSVENMARDPITERDTIAVMGHSDLRTRVVNGVREPCLKILPVEKLQNLEFPSEEKPNSLVKRVVYKSDGYSSLESINSVRHYINDSRFNLFTGNQTLEEREESFKVKETVVVNCGFYSEHGGFKISEEDKSYMQTCRAAVLTCAFGGGDDLHQPTGMTETSLKKVCYVAFWDEITLSSQEIGGKKIDEGHMIGYWRIIVVQNLPFSDQRLNGKIPKMLVHRLFPKARYSIWVDSKSQFRRDPLGVFETILWRTNSELALSEHGARSSVYDEAKAVVKKNKATPEEVEIQMSQYRHDGFPDDKRFNGKKALCEASVIVKEHTPMSNLFMCLWFNEVVRFTSRDQLSFPYVLWRLKVLKTNRFPVCTRKDLVNSIGHRQKVKPLTGKSLS